MDRRARFEYGTAEAFEATVSSPPWLPGDDTVGGVRIAAGGVPATYVVRRDALAEVQLRIWESEWEAFLALVVFGQTGEAFIWLPDADEPGTSYGVYLQEPAPGAKWAPGRDGQFPRLLTVTLTLRGAGSTPWTPYFDPF